VDSTQPLIALLTQAVYDDFIRPLPDDALKAGLRRLDPAEGYAALVQALNESQSPVLMIGWGSLSLPDTFMHDCPSVRYVCHLAGGVRTLVPRALIERGLLVTNWGNVIADTIAEAALFLTLGCLRRAVQVQMNMHVRRGWREGVGEPRSLIGRTVGVHGFGFIARQLVRLLEPFQCRVSAYSPSVPDEVFEQCRVRRETALEGLFAGNDVIVELAALTQKTAGMVDERLLRLVRPGGVFVNVGRGAVVDEVALARIAAEGKIWVGLDVYAREPLSPESPLRGLENVLLTPHAAGPTQDRRYLCGVHALNNLRAFFGGEPMESIITLAEYDRMT